LSPMLRRRFESFLWTYRPPRNSASFLRFDRLYGVPTANGCTSNGGARKSTRRKGAGDPVVALRRRATGVWSGGGSGRGGWPRGLG
jgi:hypothetical protein